MAARHRAGEGENEDRGREPRWRERGLQGPGRPRRGGSYEEDPDRRSRRGYLGPDDLQPGYQAGRGRGYASEQAFGGRYATGQDLFRDDRGVRGPEGAWGEVREASRRPAAEPGSGQRRPRQGSEGRRAEGPAGPAPRRPWGFGPSRPGGPEGSGEEEGLGGYESTMAPPDEETGYRRRGHEGPAGVRPTPRSSRGASPRSTFQGEPPAGYPDRGQAGPHAGRGPRDYRRADERIAEELCDELMRHPEVDPSEMSVEVRDGEVHLTGSVPDRWTKFVIEEMADSMLGVRDVHNQLRVRRSEEEEERRLGTAAAPPAGAEKGSGEQGRGSEGRAEEGGKTQKRRAKGSGSRGAAKKEPGLH
jgi:hypothetical protein